MINKIQNNNPAFTSKIKMNRQTAKALNLQPAEIKNAIMKDLEFLRGNGHGDKVTINYSERPVKAGNWACRQFLRDKVLTMDVVEKRGTEYFASEAENIVSPYSDAYSKPLDVIGLYKTARENMHSCDTAVNKFMNFV